MDFWYFSVLSYQSFNSSTKYPATPPAIAPMTTPGTPKRTPIAEPVIAPLIAPLLKSFGLLKSGSPFCRDFLLLLERDLNGIDSHSVVLNEITNKKFD